MATDLIRRFAERVDRALSHPLAIPSYIIIRALTFVLPVSIVTVVLSDFANLALISSAIANARRAALMQCQIAELVRVDERIDEHEVEDAAGKA